MPTEQPSKPTGLRARKAVTKALRALMSRPGQQHEVVEYIEQTYIAFNGVAPGAGRHRNDRGMAILLVNNLENALSFALECRLRIGPEHRNRVFEDHGPLASFDGKLKLAFALGIVGAERHDSLVLTQLIRNVFAHAPSPVNFSTPEISEACELLVLPAPIGDGPVKTPRSNAWTPPAREWFRVACERTTTALHNYAASHSPSATPAPEH